MTTTLLPPTARDFEIHRLCLVEFLSTRRIAEKFEISQTRVRQIVARVSSWLAQTLPLATEADQEREKRLAMHLAAAQLQHQVQQLQVFWNETSDPKYLRQQTRAILALARLGITPGALEALAADAEESNDADPTPDSDHALVRPICNPQSAIRNSFTPQSEIRNPPPSAQPWTLDLGPSTSPASLRNPQSAICNWPPPPPRDCSPQPASALATDAAPTPSSASTTSQPMNLDEIATKSDDHLAGLNLLEQRLLTLLGNTPLEHLERRQSLEESLNKVRAQKASHVLELSPQTAGVITHPSASHPAHHQPSTTDLVST